MRGARTWDQDLLYSLWHMKCLCRCQRVCQGLIQRERALIQSAKATLHLIITATSVWRFHYLSLAV